MTTAIHTRNAQPEKKMYAQHKTKSCSQWQQQSVQWASSDNKQTHRCHQLSRSRELSPVNWHNQHQPPLYRPSSTNVISTRIKYKDSVYFFFHTKHQHNYTRIQSRTFDKYFAGKFAADWLRSKSHAHHEKRRTGRVRG